MRVAGAVHFWGGTCSAKLCLFHMVEKLQKHFQDA